MIDLAELDKKDPEMASAVRLMFEQEEKDEEELKKEAKLDLNKQVVCIISINLPFMPLFLVAALYY